MSAWLGPTSTQERFDYTSVAPCEAVRAAHASFNDTGARFNVQAAEEAWRRVVDWFDDDGDDHHHLHTSASHPGG